MWGMNALFKLRNSKLLKSLWLCCQMFFRPDKCGQFTKTTFDIHVTPCHLNNNIIFILSFQLERIRSLELWEKVLMQHQQFLIWSLTLGLHTSVQVYVLSFLQWCYCINVEDNKSLFKIKKSKSIPFWDSSLI